MLDLLLKNGTIIDGTGKKRFKGDIGIQGEKIVEISPNIEKESHKCLEIDGYIVSPGFIDMHGHSDFTLFINNYGESKIRQGITTEVVGNCGFTAGPVRERYFSETLQYLANTIVLSDEQEKKWRWSSQKEFIDSFSKDGLSFNIAPLVGQGNIRVAVMGFDQREPSRKELDQMLKLLEYELEQGLFGLSTGLEYEPGSHTSIQELIELCKIVKDYDGIYTTHLKNEGRFLLECIDEAIEIGKKSGASIEISHLKAQYNDNWGKVNAALDKIDNAYNSGIDIGFDVYPYTAFGSGLIDLIPPWIRAEGASKMIEILKSKTNRLKVIEEMKIDHETWESPMLADGWDKNIKIAMLKTDKNRKYEGKTVYEVGKEMGCSSYEAAIRLLVEEDAAIKSIYFAMSEKDLETIMKHPRAKFCTDGRAVATYGELGRGSVHPRYYGTYPRILGRYVRDKEIITLEEAIKKSTMLPARKLRLKKRGILKEGYIADITIFNKDEVIDVGTFDDPHNYPKGIEYVVVNGEIVISNAEHTGKLPGKVLNRKID